jgi:hypothetical protein
LFYLFFKKTKNFKQYCSGIDTTNPQSRRVPAGSNNLVEYNSQHSLIGIDCFSSLNHTLIHISWQGVICLQCPLFSPQPSPLAITRTYYWSYYIDTTTASNNSIDLHCSNTFWFLNMNPVVR